MGEQVHSFQNVLLNSLPQREADAQVEASFQVAALACLIEQCGGAVVVDVDALSGRIPQAKVGAAFQRAGLAALFQQGHGPVVVLCHGRPFGVRNAQFCTRPFISIDALIAMQLEFVAIFFPDW